MAMNGSGSGGSSTFTMVFGSQMPWSHQHGRRDRRDASSVADPLRFDFFVALLVIETW